MTQHTVKQGEHATSIARQHGFFSFRTIWDNPSNAALRQKRKNPNVLLPGDVIVIPDRKDKTATVSTAKHHLFRLKVLKLNLRIAVKDGMDQPVGNADYTLELAGRTEKKKTNATGLIDTDITDRVEAQSGKLSVAGLTVELKVGHLDPAEERTGQIARLNNLGYDAGPLERPAEERFRSAVEEFQCDQKIMKPVTGVCDAKTQAKLVEVHGC